MDKGKQREIGVILSYSVMASNFIVGLLYTPFMIKSLGQAEYGNYYYVASLVSYLSLLTCGFGSAYLRFSSPYKKNNDDTGVANVNGLFLSLFLAMGTIALIVGGIMTWQSDLILGGKLTTAELATSKKLMAIMVVNLFMSFPVSIFNSYIIAQERFAFQKGLALFQSVLSPGISILILLCGYKSVGLALGALVVTIVINTITIWVCITKLHMRFQFKLTNWSQAKEVFIFSSFLLLSMIVDQVNWSVDKFLLGKLCGTAVVAIYTVGATINTYYKSIGEAISNVFVPKVYDLVFSDNGDERLTALMVKLGRIQTMVLSLVLSGFIIFGRTFIELWVGSEYYLSYYVIVLLMVPVTIPEIQKIGLEIQKSKNLHKFRSVLYAIIAVINVLLSIPLSIKFGAVGAAIGTSITVLFGNGLIMNIYYHKRVNVDMKVFWKEILKLVPALVASAVIGVVIVLVLKPSTWLTFAVCVAVYTVFYLAIVYKFGMNSEETGYIKRVLRKFIRRH